MGLTRTLRVNFFWCRGRASRPLVSRRQRTRLTGRQRGAQHLPQQSTPLRATILSTSRAFTARDGGQPATPSYVQVHTVRPSLRRAWVYFTSAHTEGGGKGGGTGVVHGVAAVRLSCVVDPFNPPGGELVLHGQVTRVFGLVKEGLLVFSTMRDRAAEQTIGGIAQLVERSTVRRQSPSSYPLAGPATYAYCPRALRVMLMSRVQVSVSPSWGTLSFFFFSPPLLPVSAMPTYSGRAGLLPRVCGRLQVPLSHSVRALVARNRA